MTEERPVCVVDQTALLDLAGKIRPDIDRRHLEGALIAAHQAGWTWERTLREVVFAMVRGEGPREILDATRDPIKINRTRLERHP